MGKKRTSTKKKEYVVLSSQAWKAHQKHCRAFKIGTPKVVAKLNYHV